MSDLISRNAVIKCAEGFTFTDVRQKRSYMDFLEYCIKQPSIEARRALEVIQDECNSHFVCDECPLYNEKGRECFFICGDQPGAWRLDR